MGRYDLNKIPDDASTPAQPVKSSSNPHIEPMEVKFLFDTEEGNWFIKINKGDKEKEDKEKIVKGVNGAGYREIRRFNTLNEAQEWCEKVGLL